MDVLEAILTRRSIREFTGDPISEENLKTILKAGFQAPSARNLQPREYVVVRDEKVKEKIAETRKNTKTLLKASCGIIVCGDKKKQPKMGFLISDCSASIQNMLLAAHSLSLGAVWCGLYPEEGEYAKDVAKILKLPEHIVPIGMVVVGIKDEEKPPIDRYDESKIHFDKW